MKHNTSISFKKQSQDLSFHDLSYLMKFKQSESIDIIKRIFINGGWNIGEIVRFDAGSVNSYMFTNKDNIKVLLLQLERQNQYFPQVYKVIKQTKSRID